MNLSFMKNYKIPKMFFYSLINLPTPINISSWWNFGSILGLFLLIQIMSGFFLSFHYSANINYAFLSIIHINNNINNGWIIHAIHSNGASFFFLSMYCHIGRGIYYGSFNFKYTWLIGTFIYLFSMMTAFMGYVLPWGQMSFWGATVITNLLSTIPYLGNNIVQWIWGGFSINNATLNRFFSLHFILPFIILIFLFLHLMSLHTTGSSNPLGLNSNFYKISFHQYFTIKDLVYFFFFLLFFFHLIFETPWLLNDPENFFPANSLTTPIHIQPEWYFLFAYAILRSIPNKLGGVIALMMSIMILMILPFYNMSKFQNLKFYPLNQSMFWFFISTILLLTWIGAQPIEPPFLLLGQFYTFLYFFFFILNSLLQNLWDMMLLKIINYN
uniref:Cytochrome b n=1 Tax=Xiphydria sp. ZJUH 2008002 TaxID=2488325 RepID=A0A3G5BC85_9HYME|nr:cytochrome b [Euxiphydria potanini]AYV97254.1 cytochrome b [Xiphydria sp. ZJUH 2008002]UYW35406.1 cytochrome b [Euxiphydria potanini]